MTKIFKKVIGIILISAMVMGVSTTAFAEENETKIYKNYIETFMEKIEGKNIEVGRSTYLYSCDNNAKIALLYEFTNGYAIIDINKYCVLEYSLNSVNPYKEKVQQNEKLYYVSPFEYYYNDNGVFRHVFSNDEYIPNPLYVHSAIATLSEKEKHEKLNLLKGTSPLTKESRVIEQSNSLTSPLSTDWINGYCGPTSAYNMLEYRGLLPNGYIGEDAISLISDYTNKNVTLSTLKKGMNSFLQTYGFTQRVESMNYSFTKVMSEIKADKPLTLGTNGGGLADGGHVQTIHGYNKYALGTSITYYTLYVNNSWGDNDVAITYETTVPSYLKDHVYFIR